MLFNSFHFIAFFLIVTIAFFSLSERYRWALLFAASFYFYMAFIPVYVLILFFTIVIDYVAVIAIERSKGVQRKWFLILSLISSISAPFKFHLTVC
jgi:alginate O-acetyltransferase complex protein AlgI